MLTKLRNANNNKELVQEKRNTKAISNPQNLQIQIGDGRMLFRKGVLLERGTKG